MHLKLLESYERCRSIFRNDDICIELESKSKTKDATEVIKTWMKKLKFDINEAYRLSWNDKYLDLCQEQNKKVLNIVRFEKICHR